MRRFLGCCLLVLGVSVPALGEESVALAGDPFASPYVYQNTGRGPRQSFTVQYEVGYGTRESRNFAQQGVEQGLRLRYQPLDFLGVEAFGGIVIDASRGGMRGQAAAVEVIARALRQDRHHLNLDLGLGYIYDYRSDHIPRIRLTLGRAFGALDLSLSGLLEVPVGSAGRDEVDVMTSLAVSYGVLPSLRVGLEVAGEDLEGIFEEEEAEGGAKILFGPTLAWTLPQGFFVKLNTSAVRAFLGNQRFASGEDRPAAWGFMGRLALGWTWQ
ncbi:MAG TPA: hypothetical protein PLQ97_05880 [Myxococcota bacterium]|nr:hypothetical protein [Myxococcota bacterium]HQK50193.1 hypothetical protein [Myxococcota bacterium]